MGFENMPTELQGKRKGGFENRSREWLLENQKRSAAKKKANNLIKRSLRESMLHAVMEESEKPGKSNGDQIADQMVRQAKKGDVASTKLVAQITGDLAPKQVEVGGIADGTPIQHVDLSNLSEEELRKLLVD